VLAAVGSPFKDIQWDWRNPLKVWALTDDLRLYVSSDYGATFVPIADFNTIINLNPTLGALGDGQEIRAYDFDAHVWTLVSDMGGGLNCGKLSHGPTHWLYMTGNSGFGGDVTDMWHSADGITFAKTFTHLTSGGDDSGVYDYDIGPDGTVWMVVGAESSGTDKNNTKPLRIYKSTDGGATWVLNYTDTGWSGSGFTNANTGPRAIAVNQQDGNKIVVCCMGRLNAEPDSIYSTNGGTSWTRRINPAQDFPRGAGSIDAMYFANDGRLLYMHSQTTCEMWYSDDLGATWTQATGSFNSVVGRILGWWRPTWGAKSFMVCDHDFALGSDAKVFLTTDNGASWSPVDASVPTFEESASVLGLGADYDPESDRIVVVGNDQARQIDAPFTAPVKSNIDYNLASHDGSHQGVAFTRFQGSSEAGAGIGRKLGLPAGGGTWVFGGTGAGTPLIAFLFNGVVTGLTTGGELADDLPAASSALAIVDALDRGDGGGLIIIMENYDASDSGVRPIYLTQGGPFAPLDWKRATGLTAGLTTAGRVVLPGNTGPGRFHALFNNRDVWHIDGTTGVPVCTLQANVLDVGFTPNEGLWMAEEAEGLATVDCHLLAIQDAAGNGAIVKSFDDLVTVDDVLPGMTAWPVVGAQGKDVAIGPPGQSSTAAKVVIMGRLGSPLERFAAWRGGAGNFQHHIFPTNLDNQDWHRLKAFTSLLWFAVWDDYAYNFLSTSTRRAVRTKDGGATWDDLYAVPATGRLWTDFARDANGDLWGLTFEDGTEGHMEIWKSVDDGDNWTEKKDDDSHAAGDRITFIIAHPTNPNRIAAFGPGGSGVGSAIKTWFTVDGGASWNVNTVLNLTFTGWGGGGGNFGQIMLASNRIVYASYAKTTNKGTIWTSDDNGLSWQPRKTFDDILATNAENISGPVGSAIGGVLFVTVTDMVSLPWDIQIWRSNDGGQTWTQISGNSVGTAVPRGDTTDDLDGGLAYDPTEDALYVYGLSTGWLPNTYHIMKAVGVSQGLITNWQDASDTLQPISGHTSYGLDETTYGIAVIPS